MAHARWRFLRKHPLFEEIELRLRHHWTGQDVEDWLTRDNPEQPAIDAVLLDRYRQAQPPRWQVPVLVPATLGRRQARLLALEEHSALCSVQLDRCRRFLEFEQGIGVPVPEVRANIEVLARLLVEQVRLQQQLGYLPTATRVSAIAIATPKDGENPDHDLVRRLVTLPPEEFYKILPLALGEPGER
jgi:hypothetical protein